MKKFLFAPVAALCLFFTSCNDAGKGGLSPTAQKNIDALHGVNKAFDSKDFSKIGDYIADDCVDHAGEGGDIKGLAAMKEQFEKWAAANESNKTEEIKVLADDEYVMAWQRYTGKLKMDQPGMGKAGDNFNMTALEVVKMKDGKAIEHWTFMTPADMMKMMPAMPAGTDPHSSMPMPGDTTKKDTTRKM